MLVRTYRNGTNARRLSRRNDLNLGLCKRIFRGSSPGVLAGELILERRYGTKVLGRKDTHRKVRDVEKVHDEEQ